MLDGLIDPIPAEGLDVMGPDGVLHQITSKLLSKMLDAELSDHLGYERGDPPGRGAGNRGTVRTRKRC